MTNAEVDTIYIANLQRLIEVIKGQRRIGEDPDRSGSRVELIAPFPTKNQRTTTEDDND